MPIIQPRNYTVSVTVQTDQGGTYQHYNQTLLATTEADAQEAVMMQLQASYPLAPYRRVAMTGQLPLIVDRRETPTAPAVAQAGIMGVNVWPWALGVGVLLFGAWWMRR